MPTAPPPAARPRAFSAIQPSGRLHLGNWLGALREWVAMQDGHECWFCVADAHALTASPDPRALRDRVWETAALLLACGVDPARSTLFVQSAVPAHFSLAWVLACETGAGRLERMPGWRQAAAAGEPSAGRLLYPVLMAADVLLYRAEVVPVGEDQVAHLELARELARRLNRRLGPFLPEPRPRLAAASARVMALDDPTRKMSKSEDRPGAAIGLLDDARAVRAAVMRAVTDPGREVREDEARPGVANLLRLYRALGGEGVEEAEAAFAGRGYADLKAEVAERVVAALAPIRTRYEALAGDPRPVDRALEEGRDRARAEAALTLDRVWDGWGLARDGAGSRP